jgi:hypothetical protein
VELVEGVGGAVVFAAEVAEAAVGGDDLPGRAGPWNSPPGHLSGIVSSPVAKIMES